MKYLTIIPVVFMLYGCSTIKDMFTDEDKALLESYIESEIKADLCPRVSEVLVEHCTDLDPKDPLNIPCDELEEKYIEKCAT